jgi:hypothetical protein
MAKKTQAHSNKASNYETLKDTVSEAGKSLTEGWGSDTIAQLLGLDFSSSSKAASKEVPAIDPNKGLVFDAKHHQSSKAQLAEAKYGKHMGEKQLNKPESRVAAAIDYHREIVKVGEKASKVENREINEKIQQISVELHRLINSSQVLKMEFKEMAVEQGPVNAGEYHINFLEWMLLVIKQAREKVEDSGAWLSAVKGKGKGGKKDNSYWSMFKKHGTSFGLSNERNVATQTG